MKQNTHRSPVQTKGTFPWRTIVSFGECCINNDECCIKNDRRSGQTLSTAQQCQYEIHHLWAYLWVYLWVYLAECGLCRIHHSASMHPSFLEYEIHHLWVYLWVYLGLNVGSICDAQDPGGLPWACRTSSVSNTRTHTTQNTQNTNTHHTNTQHTKHNPTKHNPTKYNKTIATERTDCPRCDAICPRRKVLLRGNTCEIFTAALRDMCCCAERLLVGARCSYRRGVRAADSARDRRTKVPAVFREVYSDRGGKARILAVATLTDPSQVTARLLAACCVLLDA